MNLKYCIQPNDNYFNIKELLKVKFQISDRLLIKLKKNKKILLNGSPTFVDYNLKPFDTVEIIIDFDGNIVKYTPSNFANFRLAYAIYHFAKQ